MSADLMRVIIAKVGTVIGPYAVVTSEALREMADMAGNPYIMFNEERGELVWEGPTDAYYEYFMCPAAVQEAESAINRAMRK